MTTIKYFLPLCCLAGCEIGCVSATATKHDVLEAVGHHSEAVQTRLTGIEQRIEKVETRIKTEITGIKTSVETHGISGWQLILGLGVVLAIREVDKKWVRRDNQAFKNLHLPPSKTSLNN